MIKNHLMALCVCPALLAPPAVLAVNTPARHAVAHVLHLAADRLDRHPAARASPAAEFAALSCTPTFAGLGEGLKFKASSVDGGGASIAPLALALTASDAAASSTSARHNRLVVADDGFFTASGSTFPAGPAGPGGSSDPAAPPVSPILPAQPSLPVSGVPDTHNWVQMIAGFGLVGSTLRWRRVDDIA